MEIQQCRRAIAEIDQDIETIDMEIKKLRQRLQDLNRKRVNYTSYIAPFRRLPPEILGKIGAICLHNGESITKITGIHSSLRDAIIGMSLLWRYIRLTSPLADADPVFTYHAWVSYLCD
jgi:hypothetical protein